MPRLTPMMRQYLKLKEQYKDAILLFRLGDFYEMFNEDAKIASKILNIVLTRRGEGETEWPMCGIPYHALDSYLSKLVKAGYKVAIAEQLEEPSKAKKVVKRGVIRVVTPGTIIEENMLDQTSNNYLASINFGNKRIGVAFVDVSTGEFLVSEIPYSKTLVELTNELAKMQPAEILISEKYKNDTVLKAKISEACDAIITVAEDWHFNPENAEYLLKEQFKIISLDAFGLNEKYGAIGAAGAIMAYLKKTQMNSLENIITIKYYQTEQYMVLDNISQRNLELVTNIIDRTQKHTLLDVLLKCNTSMGARLLKQWLLRPLMAVDEIKERQDAIEDFMNNTFMRMDLREILTEIQDIERITTRILFGSCNARDLLALGKTLSKIPKIKEILSKANSDLNSRLADELQALDEIAEMILKGIVDDPPTTIKEGGMIREGYSKELDEIRNSAKTFKDWIVQLQEKERRRTGIKSLKVRFNKVFGYYIEVTKPNLHLVPPDYIRKQTTVSGERFITPELKEKEDSILSAEERAKRLELQIFEDMRSKVVSKAKEIQTTARSLAQLDVLASLAEVALQNEYHRPIVDNSDVIEIKDGRHPVVEQMIDEPFVPNDTEMNTSDKRTLIITGPNMAGKSTYMRQVALIVILAQMGSFVPAAQARIGIVDRIFTRVGAYDFLTMQQSTFAVEMTETANILNNATKRSLILLDEVGRGTSTYDGMSLAWAIAEYITKKIKARTMFATHFHHLTELENQIEGIVNLHMQAKETKEGIILIRKVVPGGTDKSYGIQVAKLAGIPDEVIRRSKQILMQLEKEKIEVSNDILTVPLQTTLEGLVEPDPVLEKIKEIDINRMTPIDALLLLKELKDMLEEREEK